MRAPAWRLVLASLALSACAFPSARAADDQADVKGNWKFAVVFPFQESNLLILDVKEDDGRLKASVLDSAQLPPPLKVTRFDTKDGRITFAFTFAGNEASFRGQPPKDGKALGTMHIQDQFIPASLERTEDAKLSQARPDTSLIQNYLAARNDRDPKSKVQKYQDLVHKAPGSPKMSPAYADLLKAAGDAGLDEDEVRAIVTEWVGGAKAYGPGYAAEVRTQALRSLAGQRKYAELALSLAGEADKALGKDAPLETRAEVARALASAARLAGKDLLAREAEARAEKLDAALDEEYHQKVPPFKPEVSLGRRDKNSDRVVLLELFTGAQCPPCVAADVAFDALIHTYKPSELITLQYHLHIPGPDPLTNPTSLARQHYYPAIRGTPSTFFNGKAEAGGGGPMGAARNKYDQYRQIIENALDGSKQATIDLQVSRSGDEIKITATAQADAKKGEGGKGQGEKKDEGAEGEASELKLRLALIEEEVRYVGGNRLRFHHHVVRSMPGGPEGQALTDCQGRVETTVKLSELRKRLEAYLSDFTRTSGGFPNPLPEIKLAHLSVVAFVQDDSDKSVLHAVLAPVQDESR